MGQVLSVPVFGGGIVLEGSSDAQRTDELAACDSYDIGPRGQLIAASDVSSFANATVAGPVNLDVVYGLHALAAPQLPRLMYVGDAAGATVIGFTSLDASFVGGASAGSAITSRFVATFASFPYVIGGVQVRLVLVCIASRQAFNPKTGLGLFPVIYNPAGPSYGFPSAGMAQYDTLGTGPDGEFAGGSKGKKLFPRGVLAYNGHALVWGYDSHDATSGDGPNRVMFSNIGNPLKWGLDPDAAGIADGTVTPTNRDFVDSDAFVIGGVGAVIRAGIVWASRAWLGTNEGLHYVEGYGRESFATNGAQAIAGTQNVIGPHALIEGPDRLLHGVGDDGHWIFDGTFCDPVGAKLRRFDSKSPGFWDLIWTDPLGVLASYPGQTNQDLVWMMSDTELAQVLIGIPYCNASSGSGAGSDTVVIKYHVATRGYTRQVFTGKAILSAAAFRREHTADRQRFMGGASLATSIVRYRAKASPTTSPVLSSALPDVTFGEYAPFGPDGVGVMARRYVTIAWESAGTTLGLVFTLTPTVDGQAQTAVKLSVTATTPSTPSNGDLWLDISGTDTNLGNGTAGAIVTANASDYLLKRYVTSWAKWVQVPGAGQQGRRVSLPIAFNPVRGTRFTIRCQCTAADRRFQIENFSDKPSIVREGA